MIEKLLIKNFKSIKDIEIFRIKWIKESIK